jgi:uncharacterized protein
MMHFLFLCMGVFMSQSQATQDIQKFRQTVEESLKKNWLVVVGLEWLKEGEQILGSDSKADLKLPTNAPLRLAKVQSKNKKVQMTFLETQDVLINGKPAEKNKTYEIKTDRSAEKTVIVLKSLEIYVIDRPKGLAFRIKDSESEALKKFKGLSWWEPKQEYVVRGRWKPLAKEKMIKIPDVQGEISEEKISGTVEFEIQGQKQELYPTKDGNALFFIFKDLTSGKSSYGPGRFLSAELEKNGEVILDFNRATNPPCASISFATCPLPPIENYMKVAIEAGAKAPTKGH